MILVREVRVGVEDELLELPGYAGELRYLTGAVDCAYSTRITDGVPGAVPDAASGFRAHLRSGRLTDVHAGYLGLGALGLL